MLYKDLKHNTIKLQPETTDDLWLLSMIIAPGDYVRAKTIREIHFGERGSGRSSRVPMVLAIRVEHIEFQPFSTRLRVRGIVVEGPEKYGVKGKRHTISINLGTPVEIIKPSSWPRAILEKIESSIANPPLLILSIDYDEYAIALVQGQGVKILVEENLGLPGKDDPRREELLRSIINSIKKTLNRLIEAEKPTVLIVAGPGFLKNTIANELKEKVKIKIFIENTSIGGIAGVHEAIRRGVIIKVLRETAISAAENFIERFEKLLIKEPERVAYGLQRILEAARSGAIEELVIVDEKLHEYNENERMVIEDILRLADSTRAKLVFVPKDSPAGHKIRGLGGLAAILRYPIPYEEGAQAE